MAEKRFFIVKNITSGEVNSPQVMRLDGTIGADRYSLLKKDINASEPTGDYVYEYMLNADFNAALSLNIFTPVCHNIRAYKRYDEIFCSEIILEFQSDAGALNMADTESLISEFIDGTGLHTTATAADLVFFGDHDATADSNADVVIRSVKGYDAGPLLPEVNGSTWSEFAVWREDMISIASTLYNGGVPVSTKEYAGVKYNYIVKTKFRKTVMGMQSLSTTTATTFPNVVPNMSMFVLSPGAFFDCSFNASHYNSNAGSETSFSPAHNGVIKKETFYGHATNNNYRRIILDKTEFFLPVGLNIIEEHWKAGANTSGLHGDRGLFLIEK